MIARDFDSPKAPESTTIAKEPPTNRSPPVFRHARPTPVMGCDAPPKASAVTISPDPLREFRSYIGTQPEHSVALRHHQTLVRDLRIGPQLYNWSVFGLAPGSLVRNFSLTGGEDGNSGDKPPTSG